MCLRIHLQLPDLHSNSSAKSIWRIDFFFCGLWNALRMCASVSKIPAEAKELIETCAKTKEEDEAPVQARDNPSKGNPIHTHTHTHISIIYFCLIQCRNSQKQNTTKRERHRRPFSITLINPKPYITKELLAHIHKMFWFMYLIMYV